MDEGIEWIERTRDDVCLLPKPRDIIFPESRTFTESELLCSKLKGHMSVIDNLAKQDAMVAEFKRVIEHDYENQGWTGWLRAEIEDKSHKCFARMHLLVAWPLQLLLQCM